MPKKKYEPRTFPGEAIKAINNYHEQTQWLTLEIQKLELLKLDGASADEMWNHANQALDKFNANIRPKA